ncbi:MAG: hypothetical protein KDA21_10625, partial [Phycisphaerales bacterium]|nr:hypothetical protein [Phycisphaerales bacterium]
AALADITSARGEDESRARTMLAAFSLGVLPADATLRAAAKAARVLRAGPRRGRAALAERPAGTELSAASTMVLTVKPTSIKVSD